MIPMMNIVAWSSVVPWVDMRQVEQDLIISRSIVDIFSDAFLHGQLRFRGGTALNKLHFPVPMRYSEDIDLVRTTSGRWVRFWRAFARCLSPGSGMLCLTGAQRAWFKSWVFQVTVRTVPVPRRWRFFLSSDR